MRKSIRDKKRKEKRKEKKKRSQNKGTPRSLPTRNKDYEGLEKENFGNPGPNEKQNEMYTMFEYKHILKDNDEEKKKRKGGKGRGG